MQLIIAEKPAVARDLARVLGVAPRGRTSFEGDGRVITWCVGHLVEVAEPGAHDPRWKHWRSDVLPMLPPTLKLVPSTQAPEQWRAVRALLRDNRFGEVVNACDAGREGELIFRYVYELAGSRLPVRRLWVSSLTDEALRAGMKSLAAGRDYEPLAAAARARAEADWLVGMNATRALTLSKRRTDDDRALWSVGRVQTPTLALLVERARAIESFVPEPYHEVVATLAVASDRAAPFDARWQRDGRTRFATRDLAGAVAGRCRSSQPGAVVHDVKAKTERVPPPLLFDLTTLQRTANQRFGWSAAHTLSIAQSLYERHKCLSYPRTDSRHLTPDVARTLPAVLDTLARTPAYAAHVAAGRTHRTQLPTRFVDAGRVSDHHAIIPTTTPPPDSLPGDERKLYDTVARRLIAAFHPDAVFAETVVEIVVGEGVAARTEPAKRLDSARPIDALPDPPDLFVARGRVRVEAGWQSVLGIGAPTPRAASAKTPDYDARGASQSLPVLTAGDRLAGAFAVTDHATRPPPRYSEASLLGAMENAGRTVADEALKRALRDAGLGTPATRAAVVETLLDRGYIERRDRELVATPRGCALIDALPDTALASAELTGNWEARLARIARGEDDVERFRKDIAAFVTDLVRATTTPVPPPEASTLACPRCRTGRIVIGKRAWGCGRWREGCDLVVPFECGGVRLGAADLATLLRTGTTAPRPAPGGDVTVRVRVVLDRARPGARAVVIREPVPSANAPTVRRAPRARPSAPRKPRRRAA